MDLRQMGIPFEKKYTQFSDDDIQKVVITYHKWQSSGLDEAPASSQKGLKDAPASSENIISTGKARALPNPDYQNIPEFCYSASFEEIEKKDFSLVPSKYIEFVNRDENIDFDEKMNVLKSEMTELLKAEAQSKKELLNVFKELGYEIKL